MRNRHDWNLISNGYMVEFRDISFIVFINSESSI
eukprot:XP_001707442.1 Hypothetical protein GL50803_39157 [Giardia lamblia ATCC 50803]